MELSRITAMDELLRAENGRFTQTSAANLAGAGLPCAARALPGAHYIMYRRGSEKLVAGLVETSPPAPAPLNAKSY